MGPQISDRSLADWLLDGLQDGRDPSVSARGLNEQMGVFGREHVCPEGKAMNLAGSFDGIGEPDAGSFRGKKTKAMITRERQCMDMTGLINVATSILAEPVIHRFRALGSCRFVVDLRAAGDEPTGNNFPNSVQW